MKKRLLALMMASAMVFAGSLAVYAEETEVETEAAEATVLNWADFEEQINASEETKAAYAGDFVEMEEIAMKIYVPDKFEQVELTDEDTEAGYIAYFTLGDDAAVAVQYIDMDEMSLEEYQEILASEYEITSEFMTINDLPALAYSYEEDGTETAVLAYATEMGYILEISFAPVNDEAFGSVALVMMGSVQAAE